jgi:transaldolase
MHAYVDALEARAAKGLPVDQIASVASFFVSRVDTLVDGQLEAAAQRFEATGDQARADQARHLLGTVAIAQARLAYAQFRELFDGPRFARLRDRGAKVQRPLWASTSVKNPAYRDVLYVEELIGADTVNTLPLETLRAFREHGRVRASLEGSVDEAHATLAALSDTGIDLRQCTQQLLDEGVATFAGAYDDLLAGVERKRVQFQR